MIEAKKEQKRMEKLILRHAKRLSEREERPVMIDGLTNPEQYTSAKMKIMLVLKEAYSTEDDKENVLYHTEYLNDDEPDIIDPKVFPAHWIASKIASGILHNWLFKSRDYEKATNEIIMKDFKSIGWVNIGKFAAPGGSTTSSSRLNRIYEDWKEVLYKQIEVYDPDIIIFGGTFGPVEYDEDCEYSKGLKYLFREGPMRAYNDAEDRLIIATYHPSQRTISKESYVNEIIHAVRRANFKNKDID